MQWLPLGRLMLLKPSGALASHINEAPQAHRRHRASLSPAMLIQTMGSLLMLSVVEPAEDGQPGPEAPARLMKARLWEQVANLPHLGSRDLAVGAVDRIQLEH
jgi:hypothetical protein